MTDTTKRIAKLNDLCRKAPGLGGRLVQTQGINDLPPHLQSAIRERVESFDAFTEGLTMYLTANTTSGAFDHDFWIAYGDRTQNSGFPRRLSWYDGASQAIRKRKVRSIHKTSPF